jgi:hypothetical protein
MMLQNYVHKLYVHIILCWYKKEKENKNTQACKLQGACAGLQVLPGRARPCLVLCGFAE